MKHAGAEALSKLEKVIAGVRRVHGLVEKKPGVFYHRSRAFLHFHEDPAGLFADVRFAGDEFERWPVSSRSEQRQLLAAIQRWSAAHQA